CPFIVTVTIPPPTVALTVSFSSCCCASNIFFCSSSTCFCSAAGLNPPIPPPPLGKPLFLLILRPLRGPQFCRPNSSPRELPGHLARLASWRVWATRYISPEPSPQTSPAKFSPAALSHSCHYQIVVDENHKRNQSSTNQT